MTTMSNCVGLFMATTIPSSDCRTARAPTSEWVAQQLLQAFRWDSAPRYLLRDRDGSYGENFSEAARWLGIREVLRDNLRKRFQSLQ
jgi:hypothetical protein